MKKTYVKPTLMMERFNLTQSIASGCSAVSNDGTSLGKPAFGQGSCGWDMNSVIIWTSELGCTYETDIDQNVGGVCYNNPAGGLTTFTS